MPVPTAESESPPSPPDAPEARVYFPELDGLRFVAFVLVYLFHGGVPMVGRWVGPRIGRALQQNGWIGVQLFFILSGFLIATLLLREEARFGRIDLRAFWVRRILRIWPLYYLTVLITFVLMPWASGQIGPGYFEMLRKHLPAFLVFLGNWSMALRGPAGSDAITVLWSVCVEEQFYLLCPLLIAFVGMRFRVGVVVGLMGVAVGGRYLLAKAYPGAPLPFQYNSLTHLDTLLSGILLALVLHRHPPGRRASRVAGVLQWPLYAAIAWLFTRSMLAHGEAWRRTWDFAAIWACGVGLIAVAVVRRGWLRVVLSYSRLVWLGKISYGLYMYHEVALWLRHRLDERLPWFPNQDELMTIATFAATVLMAAASYYGFERYFLKLKRRWTRVPSRPV